MTDHPILFSAPMVRALLEGRKKQTRRLATSPLARVRPGDRLWVREGWRTELRNDFIAPSVLHAGVPAYYEAAGGGEEAIPACAGRLRAAMHMPRWASRLTLIVRDVRRQRLQEINLNDTWAEGCEVRQFWLYGADQPKRDEIGRNVFRGLWEELHGQGSWAANPEIIALTFRVERRNVDAADSP